MQINLSQQDKNIIKDKSPHKRYNEITTLHFKCTITANLGGSYMVNPFKKRKKDVLIGDSGVYEKPNFWSIVFILACVVISCVLIYYGVMAYVIA